MKIKDAVLHGEYKLRAVSPSVNMSFENAWVKFLSVTGSSYRIKYCQVSGATGITEMGTSEGAWEMDPIIKDWDI